MKIQDFCLRERVWNRNFHVWCRRQFSNVYSFYLFIFLIKVYGKTTTVLKILYISVIFLSLTIIYWSYRSNFTKRRQLADERYTRGFYSFYNMLRDFNPLTDRLIYSYHEYPIIISDYLQFCLPPAKVELKCYLALRKSTLHVLFFFKLFAITNFY